MEDEAVSNVTLPPSSADCVLQTQRILQSVSFRNAATLQQLFQYLCSRALDGSQREPLKEYTIGVEAFGRPHDFDPKADTIVRVQIHRLRQKLKEYYEAEGRRDPVLVEIPKGHYLPTFEMVAGIAHPSHESETGSSSVDATLRREPADSAADLRSPGAGKAGIARTALIVAAALAACYAFGYWIGLRQKTSDNRQASIKELATGSDPVKAFWANLIGDDTSPVIAFPDAVFLLDNSNDLFRFRQGASDERGALVDSHLAHQFASNPDLVSKAGALYYENGYTGAGELQAISMLAGLFGQMGVQPIVKPSRDITPVDLRQHSVILLGSSFQNVAVAQLMSQGDLSFRNPDSRLEAWRAEITNAHPAAGEEAAYQTELDPATHALRMDYGIVSVQAGVGPGRHIAVLGGLDTTGTEGSAMFATSESGAEELMKAAGLERGKSPAAEMQPFQVLVKVRLEKGYEVLGVSMVAAHKMAAAPHGADSGPNPTPAK